MNFPKRLVFLLAALWISSSLIAQTDYMQQWPQFRGPFASGIVESDQLPDHWDINTGENIRWKMKIPGLGHSSPVIWEDKLFVTTAISGSGSDSLKVGLYGDIDEVGDRSVHEFRVYCIDKKSGEVLWEQLAHRGIPRTERHTKSSHANPTPATDGKYVVAFFGSEGLYCYDFEGKLVWKKDFGRMNAGPYTDPDVEWGFASSPIIHENRVIVQSDIVGDGFLVSLDLNTGKEIWRTPREDVATWSTPNFYNQEGHRQIVVNGYSHIGGYDFDTGEELWKLSNSGDAPVPTPVFAHGLIYIHGSHGRYQPIFAIRPGAEGDITLDKSKDSTTNEFIVWSIKRGAAYMPTNLIYGDYLYNLRMNGNITCFEALTGEVVYKERIPEAMGITASGVASNGKLYYSTEQGDVVVVAAGPEFRIISRNPMEDLIMASPAISGDMIYFRTQHYLVAVGGD
ncbi:MAG: PQQ-binding-like beta-propeller repeat protein [Bacteroidales bacterium]|nr:PQQ-binding-like beta-propeller repeat protein [Bacteroidales bacterium]